MLSWSYRWLYLCLCLKYTQQFHGLSLCIGWSIDFAKFTKTLLSTIILINLVGCIMQIKAFTNTMTFPLVHSSKRLPFLYFKLVHYRPYLSFRYVFRILMIWFHILSQQRELVWVLEIWDFDHSRNIWLVYTLEHQTNFEFSVFICSFFYVFDEKICMWLQRCKPFLDKMRVKW